MAAEIGWFREDGVWKRKVGDLNTWAFVRAVLPREPVTIVSPEQQTMEHFKYMRQQLVYWGFLREGD